MSMMFINPSLFKSSKYLIALPVFLISSIKSRDFKDASSLRVAFNLVVKLLFVSLSNAILGKISTFPLQPKFSLTSFNKSSFDFKYSYAA